MEINIRSGCNVLIWWRDFEKLLKKINKKELIKLFAIDTVTGRKWKKLSKEHIIAKIYVEYED